MPTACLNFPGVHDVNIFDIQAKASSVVVISYISIYHFVLSFKYYKSDLSMHYIY